jgi:hypothetical protein
LFGLVWMWNKTFIFVLTRTYELGNWFQFWYSGLGLGNYQSLKYKGLEKEIYDTELFKKNMRNKQHPKNANKICFLC